MGRARSNSLDRRDCCCRRYIASSRSRTGAWTTDARLVARRYQHFGSNSWRHGCLRIYAGSPDGDWVDVANDRRVTAHSETRHEYVGEVFWRSKAVKKLILLFVVIACASSYAVGQTGGNKRRAVKTGTPNGLFTPAIITGDLVFTSGQIGSDSNTGQLAAGGFEGQFQQVFRNLTAVLEASGSSIEHVVKATVFLADMNDYNTLNELYKKQFKGDPPARTTVQVARLPRDAKIEIEVIAVLK